MHRTLITFIEIAKNTQNYVCSGSCSADTINRTIQKKQLADSVYAGNSVNSAHSLNKKRKRLFAATNNLKRVAIIGMDPNHCRPHYITHPDQKITQIFTHICELYATPAFKRVFLESLMLPMSLNPLRALFKSTKACHSESEEPSYDG
ncbi:hypothetical protein KFU94_59845 [Chloroflexi bacterium TSY]|nr:hypothetical protein [Chloroflexi bacterium TSY]